MEWPSLGHSKRINQKRVKHTQAYQNKWLARQGVGGRRGRECIKINYAWKFNKKFCKFQSGGNSPTAQADWVSYGARPELSALPQEGLPLPLSLPACSRFQLKLDTTAIRDDSRCKPFSRLDSLRTAALSHESDTRLGESYSFIYSFAIDTVPSDTKYKQRTCRRESRNWRHIFGLGNSRYLAWITASWHRIEIHLWLPFDHLYMDDATSWRAICHLLMLISVEIHIDWQVEEGREGGVRGANRFVTNSLKRMLQLALFRLWGESICEIQKHFRHADLINCPPGRVFTQCQVFRAVLTANCITNCCIIMFDYNANASYNSIKIGHTLNWPYYAQFNNLYLSDTDTPTETCVCVGGATRCGCLVIETQTRRINKFSKFEFNFWKKLHTHTLGCIERTLAVSHTWEFPGNIKDFTPYMFNKQKRIRKRPK